jgi:hypothetical protein
LKESRKRYLESGTDLTHRGHRTPTWTFSFEPLDMLGAQISFLGQQFLRQAILLPEGFQSLSKRYM